MKLKLFLLLIVCAAGWSSCRKTEVTPAESAATAIHLNGVVNDNSVYIASTVINLNGSHDITISGKSINGGTVPAITLTNCYNVHITQNYLGNSSGVGIYLVNCKNITVDYNNITNVSAGVYVENSPGGGIIVNYNQFLNMQGPLPRGQFVQFNTVGGANNSISYNKGENIFGQSNPQDAINLYKSNGTSSSSIQVVGNWIRGGGPSTTGGGIMLGDNGGSYQVASNNILVNPGQYGMAIAGGSHISITNNSVYAKAQSFTNVGVYIWGQGGYNCTYSTISGNQVKFMNAQNQENDSWVGTGTTKPSGWANNTFGANIDATILPAVLVSFSTTTATTTTATTTTTTTTTATPVYTASPVINLNGSHDLTISGKSISGGTVPAITLTNCYNIHITQNYLGNSTAVGIYLINCKSITIDYNEITNVSTGVYVENSPGGNLVVNYNQFKNMKGPFPRGQFVQFNTVSGPGNSISYNKGENIFGSSYPEDAINVYMSTGTSSSPIQVVGNQIRGGGPSTTGGGIMLGDNGGSYQVASNNILVNPGQYGMAIAGGDHISITNNSVYGASQSFTNVGVYIWGQSGSICTNAIISGNKVKFMDATNQENDSWIGTGETTPAGWSTNVFGASIGTSLLPATLLSF